MLRRIVKGLLVLGLTASAASAQTLEGWGPFKFDMSPDKARATPGFEFGRYSRKNIMDENQGAMASKTPAVIDGISYKFDLWFNAFESLYEINLQNEATVSRGDCEARFLGLLGRTEKTYGEFGPVYAEHKKNDQDALPISVEWKKSAGSSRYQLATAYLGMETASIWDARKTYGGRYLDIAAMWSAPQADGQAVCLMQLDYKAQ